MKRSFVQRWPVLRAKLKQQLLVCEDEKRFAVLVNRLNVVNNHNRRINLENGMPGEPYVNATVEDVKNALRKAK